SDSLSEPNRMREKPERESGSGMLFFSSSNIPLLVVNNAVRRPVLCAKYEVDLIIAKIIERYFFHHIRVLNLYK
ncbi:MAG: hypothetical protein ABFD44_09200, partial [Anaerolineaceae bacterium]